MWATLNHRRRIKSHDLSVFPPLSHFMYLLFYPSSLTLSQVKSNTSIIFCPPAKPISYHLSGWGTVTVSNENERHYEVVGWMVGRMPSVVNHEKVLTSLLFDVITRVSRPCVICTICFVFISVWLFDSYLFFVVYTESRWDQLFLITLNWCYTCGDLSGLRFFPQNI